MTWWAGHVLLSFSLATLLTGCGGDNGGGGGGGTAPPPGPSNALRLQQIGAVGVLSAPVFLTAPPNDQNRLFIVEQGGQIVILDRLSGAPRATPFLDVSARVLTGGERGLLGMAFDPEYASNGRFYIHYTARASGGLADGDIVIARYQAIPPTADVANPTEAILKTISHSQNSNHNGGMLSFGFGQDRCLYAGIGDGGGSGDPSNNAQTTTTLLGKILRLDPFTGNACAFVTSNPFATSGGAPEVWSYGLRNPWRFSFDRTTGDLYIGDVGQSQREEVDVAFAPSAGRQLNFGWRIMEGTVCFDPPTGCNTTGLTPPIKDYVTHQDGTCSIIGGYVYRGQTNAAVVGTYFYGDLCAGFVRSLRVQNGALGQENSWPLLSPPAGQITSFGEDALGELYLLTHSPGAVFRLVGN